LRGQIPRFEGFVKNAWVNRLSVKHLESSLKHFWQNSAFLAETLIVYKTSHKRLNCLPHLLFATVAWFPDVVGKGWNSKGDAVSFSFLVDPDALNTST
jgi:hypothetical protein